MKTVKNEKTTSDVQKIINELMRHSLNSMIIFSFSSVLKELPVEQQKDVLDQVFGGAVTQICDINTIAIEKNLEAHKISAKFAEEDKADLQEAVDIFKKSMSTLFGVSVIKEKSDGL